MIEIRKLEYEDIEALADLHIKCWQSTYKGIISEDFLNQLSANRDKNIQRHQEGFNQSKVSQTLLLLEDGCMVGFSIFGPSRREDAPEYEGEIYAIYLLETHQNKGLGQMLMAESLTRLMACETYRTLVIWALAENKYKRFYEKLGGHIIGDKALRIGDQSYREVCFFFEDLHHILIDKKVK